MANFSISLVSALIVSAGIAAAGFAVGTGIEHFRTGDRSVTIKGLAEKEVESDFAVWQLGFRRADNEFAGVQRSLTADRDKVVAHLMSLGFSKDEIEIRPVLVEDRLAREYVSGDISFRFSGQGQVIVQSPRVQLVERATNEIDPLIEAGVQLSSAYGGAISGPNYQLRGFNDIKPALLAEATANAREQAEKFAADAGAKLGSLRSANQGVIQIFGASGDDHDSSSTRMKRLRVVSTFIFDLK
jgi:hypothetical protein